MADRNTNPMWTDNTVPSQFITADEIIKNALTDMGEDSPHLYARFKTWLIRGYNELTYDVLKRIREIYLPVDGTTKTAILPNDFVQWTRVGTVNQGNEISDLTHDPNLVFHPVVQEGCPDDAHCSCGCTDPLCAAISNATTTTEDVVIQGTTYQKTTTVCTNESGNITARICTPVVTSFGAPDQTVNVDITSPEQSQRDIYAFTSIDNSINGEMNGDPDYINFFGSFHQERMWDWGGATDLYKHVLLVSGDQYNFVIAEIEAVGKNPADIQDGIALHPPGFDYTTDLLKCMQNAGVTKAGYTTNLSTILIPYIGSSINYAALDYTTVLSDFNNFLALCVTYGVTCDMVQIGLEQVTNDQKILFQDGGTTYGKICEHLIPIIHSALPSAKIYLDGHTFDINAAFPHWETDTWAQLSTPTKAMVSGIRQYFQVNPDDNTYGLVMAAADASRIQTMIDFVADFGIFNEISVQQVEFKAANTFRNTITEGVFYAKMYINMILKNIENNYVITNLCFQTIHSISAHFVDDGIIYPMAYYVQLLSGIWDGQIVPVTIMNNPDLISVGSLDGTTLRVYVVNPTGDVWNYVGLTINGNFHTNYASFAYWGSSQMSKQVPNTDTTTTRFQPYSLTVLTIETDDPVSPGGSITVETVCIDEIICKVETKPCGCPVLNNEVVNTLQQWSTLFLEFVQRDLNGLDWQQTFKQPLSWFGYFNIDSNAGIMQLDPYFPFDTVFMQYYSANEIDGGDYLVPIFAQEALAAYIKFKYTFNKSNISGFDKKLYQKAWYSEKNKLNERMNPMRFAQIMDVVRSNPRP